LNESKATRYQRLRRRTQVISLAAGCGLLLLVALTPAGEWLAQVSAGLALSWPAAIRPAIAITVFVGALAVTAEIVALPISVVAASRASKRAKRTEAPGESLTASQARDALAGAMIALAVAGLVRAAMWAGGPWWWALASLMFAGSTIAALGLVSLGLSLSGETRPLTRTSLVEPLMALAQRACGRPVVVREWTPASAPGPAAVVTGVAGVGKVLLSSEMVRDWADDEIAVVVAHELSHHAHHDLARKVGLDAALWCVTLGVTDRIVTAWGPAFRVYAVTDLAALPLLALAAGAIWCLLRPIRLAQSRAHERRADRFALDLTGNREAFARALRRLGDAHLAEERPSKLTRWFFHRHPTVEERLAVSARRQ
jgi:STE24 endopeptidase